MRHNPLICCSGTFHSNSQPRKPSCPDSGCLRNQRWPGESAAILWTHSVTTIAPPALTAAAAAAGAYWHLYFSAVLRTCPGAGIAEINSKHNRLSGSQLPQVNFPHTIHGKKQRPKSPPQDKMLSIPNGCRNANQNDSGHQISPLTMAIIKSRQTTTQTERGRKRILLSTVGGNIHWL